jgi:ABC-2 type transport system ATP-binding protein
VIHAVTVNQVSHQFGPIKVLDNVTLSIPAGRIYGLLGPSGSGKTTLIRLIAGALTPTSGSISVLDNPVQNRQVASRIGYMTQGTALYTDLTLRENLEFFGDLYGIPGSVMQDRIEHIVSTVDLTAWIDYPLNTFSGGMRQRSSLAAALMHDPDVLLLDEPTVGLDPVLRYSFWEHFRSLANRGKTLLVSSHIMDEADRCDELAFVRNGQLLVTGTPLSIREQTGADSLEDAFLRLSNSHYTVGQASVGEEVLR